MLVLKGIEAGIQCIMVGNGDGVQLRTMFCDEIQQGVHAVFSIAGIGMHVNIGASDGLLCHGQFLIASVILAMIVQYG